MKKRILSLLLCLTLCFTLLPTSVFAEGEELDFSELQDQVWWFETSLNQDDYTEDSWAYVSDCYEHASYLLNHRDTVTSQGQIDNAVEELNQAIDNLVSILHDIYFCSTCFQNGSVTSNKGSSAAAGEIVTLTVLPGDGYALREDVTVEDPTIMNPSVKCTKVNDKTYTFVMPEYAVEVCAIFVGEPHTHDFTGAYKDNGDGTHSRKCIDCDEYSTPEAHSYTDGVCVCGAAAPHTHDFTGDYKDNGDGTHSRKCTGCDQYGSPEAHSYTDGFCVCGAADPHTHDFTGAYRNNGDGTHSRKCAGCDQYGSPEAHVFTDGVCVCGLKEFDIRNGTLVRYNGAGGDVVIPDEVTLIQFVFQGNKSITSVTIPSATKIDMCAFMDCTNLTSVNMPNVAYIGGSAFYNCVSLTSVSVPNATTIDPQAFYNCESLTSVSVPNATNIDVQAFLRCGSLTSINMPNATNIGHQAFAYCISLPSVSMPNVTDMGNQAFAYCDNLASVSMPKAVSLSRGAFTLCANLTTLTVSDDINELGDKAFLGCNISIVNYPCTSDVDSIKAVLNLDCTYTPTHNFTDDYVDLGDGTHAHKCADCNEHDTPEAHSFTNGVCVCGAKDPAVELEAAKKNAIAEINAKKNDENASVVDAAIAAIEKAASVEEVTKLLNQAFSDLDDFEIAKQRARYKEKITNELLPAAKCDEAREILNKALADLDNAETVSDMDSIMNNAEEAASDKDDEFRDWCLESNLYFKDALTDASSDETKAFVSDLEQAIADATSIAQVKDIFNNNKSKIDFYSRRDNMIAYLNECISSDESSDDMKAIAQECLNKVKTATTMDELDAITAEFEPRMELQEAKDDFLAECNEMLTSGEYSDEMKSLIQDMMEEVKGAETIDEFGVLAYKTGIIFDCGEILSSDEYSDELKDIAQKILDEIKTAATADECDAVMEKYEQDFQLQLKKDEAKEEIEEILPEDASDAVKKIISDACDEIQASDDPSKYDEIIENAKKAVEAQLLMEEDLAVLKEACSMEIDATVPADASDAVKEVAEKAKAAIDAAETAEEVEEALDAGIEAIKKQIADDTVAKEKAQFKETITNELLPAAKCDEAREILNQALADLDNAATRDDVNRIFNNARGAANGKDSEFEGKRSGYTNAFNSALTSTSSDETKAFVAEMQQALADATSIAQVEEIYNTNKDRVGLCLAKDGTLNGLSSAINSDEYSDAWKAIAQEYYNQVKAAATVDELNKIRDKFSSLLELQTAKDESIAAASEVLTSDKESDEMKTLAQDYIEEVKAAETMDELEEIWNKYSPLIELQYEKDYAREDVKELLPENASDAVKKIISDACDEIQANDDPNQYAEIVEAAKKAVEAQLQNEKELAPVKESAIAEINEAKTDANTSVAEDAIKAINNAQSEDEISTIKEQALADMAAADAAAELAAAKEAAKAAIDNAVPADASDAVKTAAENAKAAIDAAKSVDDVNTAKESGVAAIEKQIADEAAAAELAAAKDEAKAAIDEAVPANASDAVKAAAENAKAAIDEAKSVEDVNTAKESGVAAIEKQIADEAAAAELAAAKEEAKAAIDEAVPADASDAVKAAAEEAKTAIDNAKSVEDVNAAKESGITAIEDQIAADAAAELAAAKEAAKAAIDNAVPADASDAVKTVAENAKAAIDAAKSVDDVNTAKESGVAAIEKQIADEAAAAELAAAKDEAKAAIDEAVPANASDAVKAAAENAKAAIDEAKSVEDVNTAKESGVAAIEKQIADEAAAAELAAAKEEAKAAIDEAVPADASDAVKAAAEKAKTAIDNAKSVDDVNTAKESGVAAIEKQIAADAAAELAAAKEAAKAAIDDAVPADASDAVKAAAEEAKTAIDNAKSVEDVNAAKESGIAAIKNAKAGNVPPAPVAYTIIDGANSVWTKGSDSGLLVRSDAPFAKFVGVKVDGKAIAATNYTAKEGSTIVTLTSAYLETLETGKHSIEIVSADGSASTYFTIMPKSDPNIPQTGDNSNILLWVMLLAFSGAALTGTAVYNRKKRYN